MCGIAGIFEYGRASGGIEESVLLRMRETIRHRGPDGEGLFVSPDRRLGFAHRRLAIIDLDGGAQPMHGPNGTCLVFNGEIYNYPALRATLLAEGVRFRTRCDTEVILHLYQRYGDRCVEHLTGMFAFALFDPERQRVFFARDPIGEKPLYWADRAGVFVFASEIKALLEHPLIPREVNRQALGPYLANLVTPAPQTTFRGIYKLPAGWMGHCGVGGTQVSPYASITATRGYDRTGGQAAGHVRELLDESVRARLMSDVPLGVLLSGGMDSTTILALASQQTTGMASFTVAFAGHEQYDERDQARAVARLYGTDHHEVLLSEEDAIDILAPLIHHQDEPLADPVCVPLHAVCRLAREQGIKVVLAGEGADELFWGYAGYQSIVERWRRFERMLALPQPVRRVAALATSADRTPRRREQLEGIAAGRMNPIHMPVGLTAYQRRHLLSGANAGPGWAPALPGPHESALETLAFDTQEYEFEVRLPELLLMRIDRFSMANSVEARVPFLDPALVDYVYRLPLDAKIANGVTKAVLKQAVADIVPASVSGRPKQGFAAPTSRWFAERHGGVLTDLMGQDALRAYFDVDYLARLLRDGDANHYDYGHILWPVLNFGLWHKYWIEEEPLEELVGARA
jgi:asparagine synthase (glutamine-hydrolysing)